MSSPIASAYADGGVLGPNPSRDGGTWAVVLVGADGREISRASGVVTPAQLGVERVTNNASELYACLQALSRLPDGWDGTLYTDSGVTRCRLVNDDPGFAGIPAAGVEATFRHRARLPRLRVVLLAGHPNRSQLAAGVGRNGLPVSPWNVLCDLECRRAGEAWLRRSSEVKP